jgi:hypothetical protein
MPLVIGRDDPIRRLEPSHSSYGLYFAPSTAQHAISAVLDGQ